MIRLRVWAHARPMGWLGHAAADFFFEYDPEWLAQPGAFVLAPQFALQPERYTGVLVRHFFDNLLPEGEALEDIMAALQLRHASRFDVLGRLGQELPGVLALLPEGAQPEHRQQYRSLPHATLSEAPDRRLPAAGPGRWLEVRTFRRPGQPGPAGPCTARTAGLRR